MTDKKPNTHFIEISQVDNGYLLNVQEIDSIARNIVGRNVLVYRGDEFNDMMDNIKIILTTQAVDKQ